MDAKERSEGSKTLAQDVTRARDIEAMMNTEGWKRYEELLNNQIVERTKSLFDPTPEGGRDAEQHNKGAVYAFIYARDLPLAIVAAMKDARKSGPAPGDD